MSTLKLDTLSNKAGTASVPSDTIVSGTAKAWVNFNGTGTPAIRRAFNVSSITDNGAGDYTVNFTSAMPDANYSAVATVSFASGDGSYGVVQMPWATFPTTSAIRMGCPNYNSGTAYDHNYVSVAIFS